MSPRPRTAGLVVETPVTQRPSLDPANAEAGHPSPLVAIASTIGLVGGVVTLVGLTRGANGEGPFLHAMEGIMAFFPSAVWGGAIFWLVKTSGWLPTALPAVEPRPVRPGVCPPRVELSPDRALVGVRLPRGKAAQWLWRNERWWACLMASLYVLAGPVAVGVWSGSSWPASCSASRAMPAPPWP